MTAILNNVRDYLNPPIKNIGYKGILKTSVEIKAWFKTSTDVEHEFCTTAMIMEKLVRVALFLEICTVTSSKKPTSLPSLHLLMEAYEQFVDDR